MTAMSVGEAQKAIERNVADALGFRFEVTAITDEGAELRVPYHEGMLRLGGTISGPILMTLVDTALYAALIGHAEHGEFGVTSHLQIEFLRRPEPAPLRARCRILHLGRRQMKATVEIASEGNGRPVVHATGAYALFPPTKPPEAAGS